MSHSLNTCSARSLELFLAGDLKTTEQHSLERHLADCADCRHALENLAAPKSVWQTASRSLSSGGDLTETRLSAEPTLEQSDAIAGTVVRTSASAARNAQDQIRKLLGPGDDPTMPGRMAEYDIVEVIGQGAMGIVLKGFDSTLNRFVAIKMMWPEAAVLRDSRRRFLREARAAAAIIHPHVIPVHTISEWRDVPYLVMPYLVGGSLQGYLDQHGIRPLAEVIHVGRQIASGLAAAHAQGLIHRDIKPSNILLDQNIGRLLISDFGLVQVADEVCHADAGSIAGTPLYMSPEQARGDDIDSRSDLFSLGSLLYTMCTGRPAFQAETTFGILRRIADSEPRPIREYQSDLPDSLVNLIDQLLAKDPADRLQTAAEVVEKLECMASQSGGLGVSQDGATSEPAVTGTRWTVRSALVSVELAVVIFAVLAASRANWLHRDVTETRPASLEVSSLADSGLRYHFSVDDPLCYLVTLTMNVPGKEIQLEGLMELRCRNVTQHKYDIDVGYRLNVAERILQDETLSTERLVHDGVSRRWAAWNSSTAETLSMSDTGEIIRHDRRAEIPWLGDSTVDFLIVPLNRAAVSDGDQPDECVLDISGTMSDSLTTTVDGEEHTWSNREVRLTFDRKAGIVRSMAAHRTLTMSSPLIQSEVLMHLQMVLLTDEQRNEWESNASQSGTTQRNRRRQPLSAQQETELLADLAQNRRVLFWLHELQDRPVESFSAEVVDAIVLLTQHTSPTCRRQAERLVEHIPSTQLNPFRVDESIER